MEKGPPRILSPFPAPSTGSSYTPVTCLAWQCSAVVTWVLADMCVWMRICTGGARVEEKRLRLEAALKLAASALSGLCPEPLSFQLTSP